MKLVKTICASAFAIGLYSQVAEASISVTGSSYANCFPQTIWWGCWIGFDGSLSVNGGSVLSRLYFCGTDDIPGRPNRYSFSSLAPHNITVSGTDSRITDCVIESQAGGDVLNVSSGGRIDGGIALAGAGNNLVSVSSGGQLVGGISLQGTNSSVLLTDAGSAFIGSTATGNNGLLAIEGDGASLLVSNGASVLSPYGVFVIGRSNTVDIVGPYTQVVLTNTHFIGTNSQLRIRSGASATFAGVGVQGGEALSFGGFCNVSFSGLGTTVQAAQLLVTYEVIVTVEDGAHSSHALIQVVGGDFRCHCGVIDADTITIDNGENFDFPCGTISADSIAVSNGLTVVGDGIQVARLVLGGGTNLFNGGLLIHSNSALSGSGYVSGAVTNQGTIQATGNLVFLGPVVNSGSINLTGVGASVQFLGGFSGNPVQLQIVGGSLTNQAAPQGSNAAFSVTASGTPPLRYQWLFENTVLPGQTNVSLVLSNITLANRGGYSVVATDASGSITSSIANLTVALPPAVLQAAAGRLHSLFLKSDGSLWTMGENSSGQLGDASYSNTNRPEQIVETGITRLAAGDNHSLFLKNNGSLWTVGHGILGQLGDGANGDRNQPVQILAGGVSAISGGGGFTLMLKSDGSLWGTGDNYFGQLGDGTGSGSNQPKQLVTGGVAAISAGYSHSLIVKTNGSLWVAGLNTYGALGDGTFAVTNLFEQVVGSDVTAVAAGRYHSLFLKSDGSLWGMGYNGYGQLGDGAYASTNQPKQIVATGVTAIAAGRYFSLFLRDDGSLWGMGDNSSGQLGGGTYSGSNTPRQIVASGVVQLAAGDFHTLLVKSDGSLWGMGDNSSGQLGDGTNTTTNSPKLIVAGPPGFNQFFSQSKTGSDLQLGFAGYVGAKYALDRTFSLAPPDWMPQVTNITDVGGVVVFTNTPNPATNNFWRVRLMP